MQGASERIEGGDDLVDVEEYIADNTRGEYEEGDLAADEGEEAAEAATEPLATAAPEIIPTESPMTTPEASSPSELFPSSKAPPPRTAPASPRSAWRTPNSR